MTAAARRAPVIIAALVGVSLLVACAPDPHDVYTVDEPPATRAPLPETVPSQAMSASRVANDPNGAGSAGPLGFAPNGKTVDVRSPGPRSETVDVVVGTEDVGTVGTIIVAAPTCDHVLGLTPGVIGRFGTPTEETRNACRTIAWSASTVPICRSVAHR